MQKEEELQITLISAAKARRLKEDTEPQMDADYIFSRQGAKAQRIFRYDNGINRI